MTSTITPDINAWTARDGQVRRYVDNWLELAGIHVYTYNTGNISGVDIDDYDGKVSNAKGGLTSQGRVWLDADNGLHFDHHSERGLLTVGEKRERIEQALRAAGVL